MPHIPIVPGAESDLVIGALREVAGAAEAKARRQLHADKLKVWNNDFQHLVESELREEVGQENYDDLHAFISTVNVLEKVVRKVALNYDRPARRMVARPAPPEPEQREQDPEDAAAGVEPEEPGAAPEPVVPGQDALEYLLDFEDRDALMAEVERLVMFMEAVWVVPVVRPHPVTGEQRLEHDIITPAIGDVITDPTDPTRDVGLYWSQKETIGGKVVEVTRYLDSEQWLKFDEKWRILDGEVHGIGRKPWATFRRGRCIDSYYLQGTGNDLYRATLEVSLMRTFLSRAYRISSWKQAFVAGELADGGAKSLLSPYRPVEGGANSSVTTFGLGPETGLRDHLQAIKEWEEEIASKYGLPPHVYRGIAEAGGPLSGTAMRLAMSEALRQARERKKYLVESERDLIDADRAVLEAYGLLRPGELPPDAAIVIDPQDPDFAPSPVEQREDDEWHLEHGTRSILEIMKRENPDLTDEEAEKRIAENRTKNRRLGATPRRDAGAPVQSPFARLGIG